VITRAAQPARRSFLIKMSSSTQADAVRCVGRRAFDRASKGRVTQRHARTPTPAEPTDGFGLIPGISA
jgi:hypothetical protein